MFEPGPDLVHLPGALVRQREAMVTPQPGRGPIRRDVNSRQLVCENFERCGNTMHLDCHIPPLAELPP